MEILMDDKDLIEKLEAIRAAIDRIEEKEQIVMKQTMDRIISGDLLEQ